MPTTRPDASGRRRPPAGLRLAFLALIVVALLCVADDSVRLTYKPGYPLPGTSTAHAETTVRRTSEWKGAQGDIDSYFATVSDLVARLGKQPDCGPMPIHAATVTVDVSVGSMTFWRECAMEHLRIPIAQAATPRQLEHNLAFERLVTLTIERSNATFTR